MTRFACRFGVIHLVTTQTAVHGHHAGDLRHRRHLRYVSVARLTFYARHEMSAMGPIYSRDHFVNADPRDLLFGCRILRNLLYRGLVLRDGDVALHTFRRGRKSHELAGLGTGVALLAFQTECEMLLMAIRNRLLWRRVRARIVGHFIFRCGRARIGASGFARWRLRSRRLRAGRLLRGRNNVKATNTSAVDLFLSMNRDSSINELVVLTRCRYPLLSFLDHRFNTRAEILEHHRCTISSRPTGHRASRMCCRSRLVQARNRHVVMRPSRHRPHRSCLRRGLRASMSAAVPEMWIHALHVQGALYEPRENFVVS
jgi:hypothetical protein